MAFVDVRYNPARVALYKSETAELWNALDPKHPMFDQERAIVLFERMWAFRGSARYGYRHWVRVQWLRAGLAEHGSRLVLQSV